MVHLVKKGTAVSFKLTRESRCPSRVLRKTKGENKDSPEIVIWLDTSTLTVRELQEEIPSKSESPQ